MLRLHSSLKRIFVILVIAGLVFSLTSCRSNVNQPNLNAVNTPNDITLADQLTSPGVGASSSPTPTLTPGATNTPPPPVWYWLYFSEPTLNGKASIINPPILAALLQAIDGANRTLDIATTEINLTQISNAILRAAKRGVNVRLVVDSEAVKGDQPIIDLINGGIPLVPDERDPIMHNKFMVVDNDYVWTGSYNFTFNDTYRNNNNAIYIHSPELAKNYTAEFDEMFVQKQFGSGSPANTILPEIEIESTRIETCFAPEDHCSGKLIDLINSSRSSIRFMAFSFTDNAIGRAMAERSRASVQVSGVFETRDSDTEYCEYAYLKQNKTDVLLDGNKYNMHHKVFIIDDKTVVTGSYNFTNNADNFNDENLLIIHSPDLAALFAEEFKRVYAQAKNQ